MARIATIAANVVAKDVSWSDTMKRVRDELRKTTDELQKATAGGFGMGGGGGGGGGIMPTIDIGNIIRDSVNVVRDAYRELAVARERVESKADVAETLGLDLASLQGLAVGAAQANTSLEVVTTSTNRFIKKIAEAAEGSKEATKDLARLGLTVEDFRKLTTIDALKLVADRLDAISASGEDANAAANLFGKDGGMKMTLVLKGGSAALDEYIKRAKELGLVLTADQIALAKMANTQADLNKLMREASTEKASVMLGPELRAIDNVTSKSFWAKIVKPLVTATDFMTALGGANPKNRSLDQPTEAFNYLQSLRGLGSKQTIDNTALPPVISARGDAEGMAAALKALDDQRHDLRVREAQAAADERTKRAIDWKTASAIEMPMFGGMSLQDIEKMHEILPPGYWHDQKKAAVELGEFRSKFELKERERMEKEAARLAEDIWRKEQEALSRTTAPLFEFGSAAALKAGYESQREIARLLSGGNAVASDPEERRSQRLEQLIKEQLRKLERIEQNTSRQQLLSMSI